MQNHFVSNGYLRINGKYSLQGGKVVTPSVTVKIQYAIELCPSGFVTVIFDLPAPALRVEMFSVA